MGLLESIQKWAKEQSDIKNAESKVREKRAMDVLGISSKNASDISNDLVKPEEQSGDGEDQVTCGPPTLNYWNNKWSY